ADLDQELAGAAAVAQRAAGVGLHRADVQASGGEAGLAGGHLGGVVDEEADVEPLGEDVGVVLAALDHQAEPLAVGEDGDGRRIEAGEGAQVEVVDEELDGGGDVGNLEIDVVQLHGAPHNADAGPRCDR